MALRDIIRRRLSERQWQALYQLHPGNVRLRWEARRRQSLFEQIERYCMFVGWGRSGHSLVGQLLNAHREALIAHEAHALLYLDLGLTVEQVYAMLLRRDRAFARRGRQWTGHDYRVPGLMQGDFERLTVIGDKKGGRTTDLLAERPALFDRLGEFGVRVRVIFHVRHPLDNISSMARRTDVRLGEAAREYFERAANAQSHLQVLAELPQVKVLETHHEALVRDAPGFLRRLLGFLDLEPYPAYLEGCAEVVFDSPSRSRDKVSWPPALADRVAEQSAAFDFLKQYSF